MTAIGPTAQDIASRLGLRKYPRSWRGQCPACDYAGGTFAVRAGRTAPLLFCANGCDRATLAEVIAQRIGGVAGTRPLERKPADDAEAKQRKQDQTLALWRGSEPAAGTLAEKYLCARGFHNLAASPALRFRGDCPHPEGGKLPALIGLVTAPDGQLCAIHRTYLQQDGSGKANVSPPKASLGPVWTCAIRLHEAGAELVVGKGIESVAAAGLLLGLPAWVAISAGNMARAMVLPDIVRAVVIAVDRDPAGERAADDAARRWRAEGRHKVFVFRDRPSRREDVMGFYGDAISVRPLAFASTIKDMKGLLHNA